MDCEQALLLISAALDGELSETERAQMKEHLEQCPECRTLSEDFGVLSSTLSSMDTAPPSDLLSRVNQALEAEIIPAAPKKRAFLRKWGSLAAMFALGVCLSGVYAFTQSVVSPAASDLSGAPASEHVMEDAAEPRGSDEIANEAPEKSLQGSFAPQTAFDDSGETELSIVTGAQVVPAVETERTPADAAEQVFAYLGGWETYPDALRQEDETGYLLEQSETGTQCSRDVLRYTGLSPNGWYYTFQTFRETLPREAVPDAAATCVYLNRYAVRLDTGELLAQQDETGEQSEAYRIAIGE